MKNKKRSILKSKSLVYILIGVMICSLVTGCASRSVKNVEYMDTASSVAQSYPEEVGMAPERDYAMEGSMDYSADEMKMDPATGGVEKEVLQVTTGNVDADNRKISYMADLNIETTEYDKKVTESDEIIKKHGGIVENSYRSGDIFKTEEEIAEAKKKAVSAGDYNSYSSYYAYRYYNVTIKVPVENYEALLAELEETGKVTYYNRYTDDLTISYQDTERMKKAYETEYNKYLDLLSKAETLEDTITIESKITDLRLQLDGLETNLKNMDTRVDYSTITLNYSEVKEYSPIENPNATFGERIVEGLKNTLESIKKGSVDFAVWFIVTLPILIPVCIIAIIVIIIIRRSLKKASKNVKPSYDSYKPIEKTDETKEEDKSID